MMRLSALAFAFALAALLSSAPLALANALPAGARTLVIFDSDSLASSHSAFFDSLVARGHSLSFKAAAEKTSLFDYGVRSFDNVVLFAPRSDKLAQTVGVASLVKFIDAGGNVLVAGSFETSEAVRALANQCGVDFEPEGNVVIDHFHTVDALDNDRDNTVIFSANYTRAKSFLGSSSKPLAAGAPVIFSGVALSYNPASPLVSKILAAETSAYSSSPGVVLTSVPSLYGADVLLVATVQMRNNARVTFSGSLDLFSNKFFQAQVNGAKSANEAFAVELSRWTFAERAILRATNISHRIVTSNTLNPEEYRINDDVEFSVDIEEYDGATGKWKPFTESDVQLEYVMLDPYVRQFMKHDNKGHYSLAFRVPDVFGVYKYVIRYQRDGYSFLNVEKQVPAHPYRHDDYERFVFAAYPYYVSAFSMMAGFFVFGLVFLYNKD